MATYKNKSMTFYRYILAIGCLFAMPVVFISMVLSYQAGDMASYWKTLTIMILLMAVAGQTIFLIK